MAAHRGGHGGAWKVAYADFVTAMMALFLVLWIVAMSQEMKEAIAGYFRSTAIIKSNLKGIGQLAPITQLSRTPPQIIPPLPSSSGDVGGKTFANRIILAQATLQDTLANIQRELLRNNEEMTDVDVFRLEFMNDGVRINVMDMTSRPFFEPNTANITSYGRWVLSTIAWEIERFPFNVEIEGHTQGGPNSSEKVVDHWDLSTRRALIAQRFLEENGVRSTQFWRVAGYGDQQPLNPKKPDDEANRRISIILRLNPNVNIETIKRSFAPK